MKNKVLIVAAHPDDEILDVEVLFYDIRKVKMMSKLFLFRTEKYPEIIVMKN